MSIPEATISQNPCDSIAAIAMNIVIEQALYSVFMLNMLAPPCDIKTRIKKTGDRIQNKKPIASSVKVTSLPDSAICPSDRF